MDKVARSAKQREVNKDSDFLPKEQNGELQELQNSRKVMEREKFGEKNPIKSL